jgi:hypothetical protein
MTKTDRFCKTCVWLRRIDHDGGETSYRCGYRKVISAPWPCMQFEYNGGVWIGVRHIVPGNDYPPDETGSTADWTEVMNCPTWRKAQ